MGRPRNLRRLDIETDSCDLVLSLKGSLPELYLDNHSVHGGSYTSLSRANAAKIYHWFERFFAVGCEKHGAEGCVECEKRCTWCGDDGCIDSDGKQLRRKGERVCENCAWQYDEGEID